jgi:inositol oxygenase
MKKHIDTDNPLNNLDEWEDDLLLRYPDPSESTPEKTKEEFRNYVDSERVETVKEFYRINHIYQTYDFVCSKEQEFLQFNKKEMSIWEAVDFLNTLVDDSDPDIDLDQTQHLLQTSEAIRADGHPDWFVLTGFIHDLGKILCLFGEPQWAVVGDTFPVGCAYSDKIVYPEFFKENPDYLPDPALNMIRYHSFYSQHKENAYAHLMNEKDIEMFDWVRKFNPYDLYTKAPVKPDVKALLPYYKELVAKYLPEKLKF